jgi:MFS family permease
LLELEMAIRLPLAKGFTRKLNQFRAIYDEYPRQFWVLILGSFIDRLGGALLFPFFTLYITRKFGVGMTTVGVIFGIFSISSVVGSMFGGALTDRLGRKGMLLFGLVMSALSSLVMGLVNDLGLFLVVAAFVGVLTDTAGPARQAMVADLLPEEQRAQGFGILRVVINLAVTIGPMIGGLLAAQSYMLLFVCDAVSSLITAGVVYVAIQETWPGAASGEEASQETMAQIFGGYVQVLRDAAFGWFLAASVLMVLVYMQMNTTLAVYLRDSHGISVQGFGYILSLNAAMVVLFQFPITRWISQYRPLAVMAVGTLLYAVGFAMYGFFSVYTMFLVAMVVITIGEMFTAPVGQAIVARLAPEDMRGRYMAVFGFSWVLPSAVGPLLAGLVMDNADPRWVWYGAGILGLVAAAAFYLLEWQVSRSTWSAVDRRLDIMQRLEAGEISAEEAAKMLEAVDVGKLASLAASSPSQKSRHLRIRVSNLASGAMKADLRLPLDLVNAVFYAEGRLSAHLDRYDSQVLRELISKSAADASVQTMDTDGDERVEISVE